MTEATAPLPTFLRADKQGHVIMEVQLIPNAAKTRADRLFGQPGQLALNVRINAPPVDGKTNDALIKWLTGQLGIPRTSMEVIRGKKIPSKAAQTIS